MLELPGLSTFTLCLLATCSCLVVAADPSSQQQQQRGGGGRVTANIPLFLNTTGIRNETHLEAAGSLAKYKYLTYSEAADPSSQQHDGGGGGGRVTANIPLILNTTGIHNDTQLQATGSLAKYITYSEDKEGFVLLGDTWPLQVEGNGNGEPTCVQEHTSSRPDLLPVFQCPSAQAFYSLGTQVSPLWNSCVGCHAV